MRNHYRLAFIAVLVASAVRGRATKRVTCRSPWA